jgi:alkylation response protein AidB-like acyl-CoA dehydrogenase
MEYADMNVIAQAKMTRPASMIDAKPPGIAALRSVVDDILPEIRARALQTERARQVPEENLRALRSAGLYRIVQPQMFGGYEYDFDVLVDLVVQIARGCASTAWVYGLYAAHQWLVASFPAEAQEDVLGKDPDAAVCGSYAPVGLAEAVPEGYRLSGRWSFASGCDGAGWALCATMLPPDDERNKPGPAFLLVPARDYVIEDTWDVVGLTGTGSKTLVLKDVVVPGHRILTFRQTTSGKTPGSQIYRNPGFGVPMLCNIPSCLAAASVGAAQGALEDYLDVTARRETRGAVVGAANKMAEFPTIQLRVADASASIDAAREILLRDLRLRVETTREGREVSVEDRILSRRGQAFAVSLAIRAVEALNASTGGHGLAACNPVQRAWRDANAVGRHISMNWDAVGTMYGQMALGLDPKGQY